MPESINQLAQQIATAIQNATAEGTYCEFSVGSSEQDTTEKKKCYKIVDGMYVQVPCWSEDDPQHT